MKKTNEEYELFISENLSKYLSNLFSLTYNTKTTRDAMAAMTKFFFQENGFDIEEAACDEMNNSPEIIDKGLAVITISFYDENDKKQYCDITIGRTGILD